MADIWYQIGVCSSCIHLFYTEYQSRMQHCSYVRSQYHFIVPIQYSIRQQDQNLSETDVKLKKQVGAKPKARLIVQVNLFILGFLFVELVVATPVERRTFVSVACTAKKSKPASISFQNIRVMYIKTAQKEKTQALHTRVLHKLCDYN